MQPEAAIEHILNLARQSGLAEVDVLVDVFHEPWREGVKLRELVDLLDALAVAQPRLAEVEGKD